MPYNQVGADAWSTRVRLRSLLFVPADSERKYAKAAGCAADALILDLEDSVSPAQKVAARRQVGMLLGDARAGPSRLFVRINAFDTGLALADLAEVVKPGLSGIMLPKANGSEDLQRLAYYLDALEAASGIPIGTTRVLVVATETPAAMFALGSYAGRCARLAGLTWGAEDLATAIGATANRLPDGRWREPFRMARSQCLFASAAAGVMAIDTLYADFRDRDGLAASCNEARMDGFSGRIAIHPDQVPIINACFSPSVEEQDHALAIISAFADAPDSGVVSIDGRMFDIPHLKSAQRLLAAAGKDGP